MKECLCAIRINCVMTDIKMQKLSAGKCFGYMLDWGGNLLFASGYKNIIDIQTLHKHDSYLEVLGLREESFGELLTKVQRIWIALNGNGGNIGRVIFHMSYKVLHQFMLEIINLNFLGRDYYLFVCHSLSILLLLIISKFSIKLFTYILLYFKYFI
jgi:hypothetical protein